jgi:predicted PurR-regulated permease PerM
MRPFLTPIAWGIIISVGIYPLHLRFTSFLGNRAKLSAVLITLIGLAFIAVPASFFTRSAVEGITNTVEAIEEETLEIPPPNERVREWPLIGEWAYENWASAAQNLAGTLENYKPQLKELAPKLTKMASRTVLDILLFVASMFIAGILLLYGEQGKKASDKLFMGLLGPRGYQLTDLSISTIRSVVQGVLGIAVIQALFLSIGMFVLGVPAAGIFAVLVLILAVVQLPTLVVMLPITIYVFSANEILPAVLFAVWTLIWSVSDNFLKPFFLGKGVGVPMLVVLMGAIGGLILGGLVGLFVGSVLLTLGYRLVISIMVT